MLTSTTAIAAALAGCLGSASTGDDTSTPTASPTHHDDEHSHGGVSGPHDSAEVRMITTDAGTHFEPHVVWVTQGATVTWVNESGSHGTTAYAPANDKPRRIPHDAEAWDSGVLTEQGATFEQTFETPGVYDYYCEPHEGTGMLGTVIVGEPDAHDQPGLAEPQDALPETAREKVHSLNEKVNEALGHTHDESTSTEEAGHDDDGHHDETATGDHHDETATEHHDDGTETDDHHD